jgi:hypothetical protein
MPNWSKHINLGYIPLLAIILQVFIFRASGGYFASNTPGYLTEENGICPVNRDGSNGSYKTKDFLSLFVPLDALLIEVVSLGIIDDHDWKILDL